MSREIGLHQGDKIKVLISPWFELGPAVIIYNYTYIHVPWVRVSTLLHAISTCLQDGNYAGLSSDTLTSPEAGQQPLRRSTSKNSPCLQTSEELAHYFWPGSLNRVRPTQIFPSGPSARRRMPHPNGWAPACRLAGGSLASDPGSGSRTSDIGGGSSCRVSDLGSSSRVSDDAALSCSSRVSDSSCLAEVPCGLRRAESSPGSLQRPRCRSCRRGRCSCGQPARQCVCSHCCGDDGVQVELKDIVIDPSSLVVSHRPFLRKSSTLSLRKSSTPPPLW